MKLAVNDRWSDGSEQGSATTVLIYSPIVRGGWSRYDTAAIDGRRLRLWAFNPRSGRAHHLDEFPNTGSMQAPQLDDGPDWVWVVDDTDAGYPPPGKTLSPK